MAKILKSTIPYNQPETENLIKLIRDGLRKSSEVTLLIESTSGREWTGKQLETTISVLAKFLSEECKLEKGDVCSIYSDEGDQAAILILAIISVGATVNFLNAGSSGKDIHDTAKVMGSKVLFSQDGLLRKIHQDLIDIEANLQIVSLDGCEFCCGFTNGCKNIADLFSINCEAEGLSLDELVDRVEIEPNADIAVIQFSSGTTGKPKRIPRTHKNLCHMVASVNHEELMDLKPGAVITGSLNLTHRPGLWGLLATIHCGNTFVMLTNYSNFEDALRTIEKYKVTIFSSGLPLLAILGSQGLRLKEKYNTGTMRHVVTSGAKIVNFNLPQSIVEGFKLKSLRQSFGMTESGWVFLIEQSLAKDIYLSVGHVVPGMEAIVVDPKTNERLGPNVHGEIAIRGPQIFPGYLTSEPGVLNRSDFTADGWFKIGDQGYYDEEEKVFIVGRYKELMTFRKINRRFFPSEIEATISEHPSIEAACVVKIGEHCVDYPYDIARAFVTIRPGFSFDENELLAYVKEKSPQVDLEGGIKRLDIFPRLQNGKVDKQKLKSFSFDEQK